MKNVPRGVMPTYITSTQYVICKDSPRIRNTYEIRLSLFFAMQEKKTFILTVPPDCNVDAALVSLIIQWGGKIARNRALHYSVYFGAESEDGTHLEGWVLGSDVQWKYILQSIQSPWLRQNLHVGAEYRGENLETLADELKNENIEVSNVDNEPFVLAALRLVSLAHPQNGTVFIQ